MYGIFCVYNWNEPNESHTIHVIVVFVARIALTITITECFVGMFELRLHPLVWNRLRIVSKLKLACDIDTA